MTSKQQRPFHLFPMIFWGLLGTALRVCIWFLLLWALRTV